MKSIYKLRQELSAIQKSLHEMISADDTLASNDPLRQAYIQVAQACRNLQEKEGQAQEEGIKYFTKQVGSDRYPYEVIRKINDNKYEVRQMHFDYGCYGEGCWNYRSNREGQIYTIRRHKNGNFYLPNINYCPFFPTKEPSAYMDPSF